MTDSFYDPNLMAGDWAYIEYDPYRAPALDPERKHLAELALAVLTPSERAVIELAFGFAGDPKSDEEVASILHSTRGTVKTQRQRAMKKMRAALDADTD